MAAPQTDAPAAQVFVPKPSLPPPPFTVGPVGWLRANLFNSPLNTLLTIVCAWLIYRGLAGFLEWAFFDAVFDAKSRRECLDRSPTGACACARRRRVAAGGAGPRQPTARS
jgi:general L-amino acid transport system permease protein